MPCQKESATGTPLLKNQFYLY